MTRSEVIDKHQVKTFGSNDIAKQWGVSFWATDARNGNWKRERIYVSNKIKTIAARKAALAELFDSTVTFLINNKGLIHTQTKAENKTLLQLLEGVLQQKQKHVATGTYNAYRYALNKLTVYLQAENMLHCKATDFNKKHAILFLNSINQKHTSNKTVNDYLQWAKALFSSLVENETIEKNPFKGIKELQTEDEANQVYSETQRLAIMQYLQHYNPYLLRYTQFIYYLLCRPSELMNLKVGDINFENKTVRMLGTTTKTNNERTMIISERFEIHFFTPDELLQYPPHYYVFSKNKLKPGPRKRLHALVNYYNKILKNITAETGITFYPRQNIYSWKATGMFELERATNIQTVTAQSGHSSEVIAWKYLKRKGAVRKDIFEAIRTKQK
jgi:integrase